MPCRQFHVPHTRLSVAAVAGFCLLLAGCGGRAYESKFDNTLTQLRLETPFRTLWDKPVADFPNGSLKLRVPKIFGADAHAFDDTSPDPLRPDEPLDPYRLQPYFLELPGHQRTYEGFVAVRSRLSADMITKPYYLYVAITPTRDKRRRELTGEALAARLREQLVRQFGKEVTAWKQVNLPTPAGETSSWQWLSAVGRQYFVSYDGNKANYKIYPGVDGIQGRYVLWLHSTPNYHVLLGWRCGTDVAEAIHLDTLAATCAGAVEIAR